MSFQSQEIGCRKVGVPKLGLGCAPLGNLYRPIDDASGYALLDAAWQAGVRYFDTAPLYGFSLSERRLGAFLKDKPRDTFCVSTKVGRRLLPNSNWHPQREFFLDAEPFEPVFDYSYDGIWSSFEESRKRLDLADVDILLLHDIGAATHGDEHANVFALAMKDGLRALEEIKASGGTRAIGIGVNEIDVCRQVMDLAAWDCFLLAGRYSLLEHKPLEGFFDQCLDREIDILLGGVFNSGILATGLSAQATYDYTPAPIAIREKVGALAVQCEKHGTRLPTAALRFAAAHPAVSSIIIGAQSPAEIRDIVNWQDEPIEAALWDDLKQAGLLPVAAPVPSGPERFVS